MPIQVGEQLPAATLFEYCHEESGSCSIGPNPIDIHEALAGKTVVIFAVPGAYTPTCSAKHVPGFVEKASEIKAKGVDEIWCVSVNDAFVMGAWGQSLKVGGAVRMIADGAADFTRKVGLEMDLTARGLGIRSQRYAMVVKDAVVQALNVEEAGKFEVSDAQTVLGLL
ncbi:MAG: peroxiredoxin [Limnobacter sp.]|nr:peroxiredoxin [Limnobacter sp.]